jgi:LysR family transcriptional regulator, hca operon transcriptional activator
VRVDDPWRQGIELTAAGRVLLDHARVVLLQVEAAMEATRRAATPAKSSFVLGFLTGYEFEWLAAVMNIIRDQLPNTEVVILSQSSPDLAAGLTRGKIDLAFLRQERNAPGVAFNLLRRSGPASAGVTFVFPRSRLFHISIKKVIGR